MFFRHALAVCGLVMATVVGAAAASSADQSQDRWVNLRDTLTVADGIACGGRIGGVTVSTDSLPGLLYIRLNATFVGVSSAPGVLCSVPATVTWRNVASGATGSWSAVASGSPVDFPAEPSTHLRTESGRVELTLTTGRPHFPSVTTVDVY